MKFIKKLLQFIFNPLSMFKSGYRAEGVSSFFASHGFVSIIISVIITAIIFAIYILL